MSLRFGRVKARGLNSRVAEKENAYFACGHYPKASLTNLSASKLVMTEESQYPCAAGLLEAWYY